MWEILEHWQRELSVRHTSALFVRLLNLCTLLLFVWMLPIADQVWGMDSFVILDGVHEGLERYAMLLREEAMRSRYEWFLYPIIALTGLAVFGLTNAITRLLSVFLFINLHNGNYDISNGGWHVMHHLLLLSVFLFSVSDEEQGRWAAAKRLIHHLAFYFIWVQIAILYLVAGTHKLLGEHWVSGDALAIILVQDEFTLPWIRDAITGNNLFLKMLTWATLGYQLAFPVLIWLRRVRPWLLSAGLIFHLSIIFIVGVTDFGVFLIVAYSVFLPEVFAKRWESRLPRWKFAQVKSRNQ